MKSAIDKVSNLDTYDLMIIVSLIGGFATGNWFPFVLFFGMAVVAVWHT
jgi:hypothetical protein